MLLYIACANRTIHSSMPSFRMAHQMTFLGTRSNAFSRSTNAKYNFLFLARCFSCNCLSMNIASAGHETKLHVINRDSFPDDFFYHSLDSFHDMIKEFETSVVTSFQCITFPFVNVDDEAIFTIRWNNTISYHVIGKVSDQPCTSIPDAFSISATIPEGPAAFASFHLGDSFHHISTSICMGGPTTGPAIRSSGFQENSSFRSHSVLFPSNFLGLVVKREVTRVIFDTFVTNHILVVFPRF